MAGDMGTAAQILNQAAQECQVAEDLVNEIIREAIEFAVATLAATAVADIFTFGLATIAGGIAEGAEMTVFVARAAQVSTKLAEVLEKLLGTLKDLKALKEARGHLEGVQSVQAGQGDLSGGEGAQGGRRRAVGHESGTALRHRSGQERRSSTGTGPSGLATRPRGRRQGHTHQRRRTRRRRHHDRRAYRDRPTGRSVSPAVTVGRRSR
jgi:hypothetical protein